jgi:uncharacterized phage-associated protein
MLVIREREKMFNALIFFTENVRNAGKTKLFKLLNFLDFEHFQKTGRSVTGLDYSAWERGPVPKALYDEWKRPTKEFISHVIKQPVQIGSYQRETLKPRHKFDSLLFSKFELQIMEKLAKAHFNDTAEEISETSHFETGYWAEIWNNGEGNGETIPYELVLKRKNSEQDQMIFDRYIEDLEIRNNYG